MAIFLLTSHAASLTKDDRRSPNLSDIFNGTKNYSSVVRNMNRLCKGMTEFQRFSKSFHHLFLKAPNKKSDFAFLVSLTSKITKFRFDLIRPHNLGVPSIFFFLVFYLSIPWTSNLIFKSYMVLFSEMVGHTNNLSKVRFLKIALSTYVISTTFSYKGI